MTKRTKSFLVAALAMPTGLAAQTVSPPVPWEDVPPARLNLPAATPQPSPLPAPVTPTVTAPAPVAPPQPAPAPVAVAKPVPPAPVAAAARPAPAPAPPPGVTWQAPAPAVAAAPAPRPAPPVAAAPSPAPAVAQAPTPAPVPAVVQVPPQLDRGATVPHFWMAPQFHVAEWSRYGLTAPVNGYRWIRYYDDALLVDGYGRVADARHGLDWNRLAYAERDPMAVPVYVGHGDYRPAAAVPAPAPAVVAAAPRVEQYEGDGYERTVTTYQTCPPGYPCASWPAAPYGSAAPYGYGYGWGYGTVTITETVTTTTTGR